MTVMPMPVCCMGKFSSVLPLRGTRGRPASSRNASMPAMMRRPVGSHSTARVSMTRLGTAPVDITSMAATRQVNLPVISGGTCTTSPGLSPTPPQESQAMTNVFSGETGSRVKSRRGREEWEDGWTGELLPSWAGVVLEIMGVSSFLFHLI